MALLRQANAARASREAIVLDLGDLMRQGEMVKARAKEEAAAIVAAAKLERERLIAGAAEEGRARGHERGLEEGRKAGEAAGREAALVEFRERLTRLEAAWVKALSEFERERDSMLLQARQDVLRLAVGMGEMVTRRTIAVTPDAVMKPLAAVLDRVSAPTRLTVRIHPEDRAIVERGLPALLSRFGVSGQVTIQDAMEIERGSVVATTEGGAEVDASIGVQLQRIVEVLLPGPLAGDGVST